MGPHPHGTLDVGKPANMVRLDPCHVRTPSQAIIYLFMTILITLVIIIIIIFHLEDGSIIFIHTLPSIPFDLIPIFLWVS